MSDLEQEWSGELIPMLGIVLGVLESGELARRVARRRDM
ncbi:MAG: hypothetical protein KatS3mg067_1712 [Thermosynechococcus sp.]|nr:MAG: hypothetical protein KatS3mg067_1712 [Thermosynechococcus sp.]